MQARDMGKVCAIIRKYVFRLWNFAVCSWNYFFCKPARNIVCYETSWVIRLCHKEGHADPPPLRNDPIKK